ncbi:hypothetical protein CAPTEDRAFT_41346, partial [Capitella teleta]
CKLGPEGGECGDFTTRYYFDINKNVCKKFSYGGCGGNANNFKSKNACSSRC